MSVLITGASSGIGSATARLLTRQGLDVINLDCTPPLIEDQGLFIQVDLCDRSATAEALRNLLADRKITGLINNVAAVESGYIGSLSFEQMQMVWELNVRCPIQCAQAVLPAMKESRYGRIVNISSRAALGKVARTLYAASKAGLHAMTKTWCLELAEYGITVNTVSPGPIETAMYRQANLATTANVQNIHNVVPVKRMGAPDDIAHAVAFFMDSASSFITGQNMFVDGGMSVAFAGSDTYSAV